MTDIDTTAFSIETEKYKRQHELIRSKTIMRKRLPPLNALRSFEAAARHNSFRDAADELCVSHSAVSHQIKLLETYLDIELFKRKSRSVELTDAGKQYYPDLRDAFDKMSEATAKLFDPSVETTITLKLYNTFAIRWFIPRLAKFKAEHPDYVIRISTSQEDVNLHNDGVDCGILIGEPDQNTIEGEFLFRSNIFPVCSPEFLESHSLKRPRDLKESQILQVYPSSEDWYRWFEAVGIKDFSAENGLSFDSYDHAIKTAKQSLGVTLAISPYVTKELEEGSLVECFPPLKKAVLLEWFLAYKPESLESKKLQVFKAWLMKEVAADSALDSAPTEMALTEA